VTSTGVVNANSFIGDGSKLTGIKVEIPLDVTFDNVSINKGIVIGKNATKIINVQRGVVESKGVTNNYEMLEYKFPPNSFSSDTVIVFTSIVCGIEENPDKNFIVAKNYGYNSNYNCVYIQARDLLGSLNVPYSVDILAIEYSY
jgi:hypothetical protein